MLIFSQVRGDFLTTKHSPRFANHGALTVREKIAAGMDFRGANRLQADYASLRSKS